MSCRCTGLYASMQCVCVLFCFFSFFFSGFCFKQCLLISPAHARVYFSDNQEVWFLFQHWLFAQNFWMKFHSESEFVEVNPCFFFVLPGHHAIFWPCENPWASSPYVRKRSGSQVPFPEAALFVSTQYGGCTGHTDQQLRPQPGEDPYRRQKPREPQHPLL